MNFRPTVAVKSRSYFGAGTGQIWLDDVKCSGNESSLDGCAARQWGQSNCGHDEDLGVICRSLYKYYIKTRFSFF